MASKSRCGSAGAGTWLPGDNLSEIAYANAGDFHTRDAGSRSAFKEGWRGSSKPLDRQPAPKVGVETS